MEFIKPKIELYKTRSFSDKLTDTFDFLRETWKPMLKYFVYLMLPCSIVLGFFLNHFYSGYMEIILAAGNIGAANRADMVELIVFLGLTFVAAIAAYTLLLALIFAIVRLYRQRDDRLEQLTADELKPELMLCLSRSSRLMLASIAVAFGFFMLVIVGLAIVMFMINVVLGVLTGIVIIAGFFAIVLPFTLIAPIYMLEDNITIIGAIKKSFHLGFPTWGGIFAVSFVIGIIASVIETVTMVPWYVLYIVKMVFTLSDKLDGSFTDSIFYTFAEYITCVLECLGVMIATVINTIALTIQYGHAADKIDGVGVVQKIEKFDELDNF